MDVVRLKSLRKKGKYLRVLSRGKRSYYLGNISLSRIKEIEFFCYLCFRFLIFKERMKFNVL